MLRFVRWTGSLQDLSSRVENEDVLQIESCKNKDSYYKLTLGNVTKRNMISKMVKLEYYSDSIYAVTYKDFNPVIKEEYLQFGSIPRYYFMNSEALKSRMSAMDVKDIDRLFSMELIDKAFHEEQ